jgi:VanZ family protein
LRQGNGVGLLCAVAKLGLYLKYWWPVVIWAVVIFSASADSKSVQHSSRLIEPFVRWLVPDISDEGVRATVLLVRKTAHLVEYAIFAVLLWIGFRGSVWPERPPRWSRRAAAAAIAGAILFAITDEIHQTFVPGRQGAVLDVIIDSIGAGGGIFACWLVGRWRKRW